MKNLTPVICCILIITAYAVGQNNQSNKRIENCCCKHQQQIAEDLHKIVTMLSKDIKMGPIFSDPGPLKKPEPFKPIPPIKNPVKR